MKNRHLPAAVLVAGIITAAPALAVKSSTRLGPPDFDKKETAATVSDWSYSGKKGPQQWGSLKDDYVMCSAGSNQSPVNLSNAADTVLPPLELSYQTSQSSSETLRNNGNLLRVDFADGNTLQLDGITFTLQSLSLHTPAEHTIDGMTYPLELQFQHQDDNGHIAVVSVLVKYGDASPELEKIRQQLPLPAGQQQALKTPLNIKQLLPNSQLYYRYNGSLTTPPCSEGVRWMVLISPASAAEEQIRAIHDSSGHNSNRPLQPLNARRILE